MAWEDHEGGIIVKFGVKEKSWERFEYGADDIDSRFLVPDCLMSACIKHSQIIRHFPNGIEYPKGE